MRLVQNGGEQGSTTTPDGNILAASNMRHVDHLRRAPSWEEIEAKEKESRKADQR